MKCHKITLSHLEEILRRENSVIADEDIENLLGVIEEELGERPNFTTYRAGDGHWVVHVDTPTAEDGPHGPAIRVYVNEGIAYDGTAAEHQWPHPLPWRKEP